MEFYGGYLLAGLNFAFPMDDPYIHLAMGKNLAAHGSWGPMAGVFNSSSSSLLYTLIISAFFFLGIGGLSTLIIINLISSFGCLYAFEKIAKALEIDADKYMILSFSFVLIVPLYHIAYLSMEHTLHIWIMMLVVLKAAVYFSENRNDFKSIIWLSIWTSLAITTRYESLFFGLIVGIILLYRKQFKNAIIFGVIALLPISIFGIISIINGENFLPNSVLVKGVRGGEHDVVYFIKYAVRWLKKMVEYPDYGLAILIVAYVMISKIRAKTKDIMYWFSIITFAILIIHGSFADIGWLGRYEAYLIALSLGCLVCLFQKYTNEKSNLKYVPYALLILFVLIRTITYTFSYRYGIQNIFDQQYQMSQFVKEYYNNDEIVINDIGTTSYYTNAKYLDLWALASTDLANYKLEYGDINQDIVAKLADDRSSKIAIIYNEPDFEYVPGEWRKVASWTIQNRQVSNFETIYFYAINVRPEVLMQQVAEYSKIIPAEVKVEYFIPKE